MCVCVCVSVVIIPRYTGMAPADVETPQWITHGGEGFTEKETEINGGRYTKAEAEESVS